MAQGTSGDSMARAPQAMAWNGAGQATGSLHETYFALKK
jgi:hypothetical protein